MSIADSNFRISNEWGEKYVVHDRQLGEKVNGVYPGKKWSDVVIDNVSLDDTIYWDYQIENLLYDMKESQEKNMDESITINERDVYPEIRESSSHHREEKKGHEKFYREKKVPQKNNKNYPTKPKIVGDEKVVKVSEKQDYFNWEITKALHEDRDVEEDMFEEYQWKLFNLEQGKKFYNEQLTIMFDRLKASEQTIWPM